MKLAYKVFSSDEHDPEEEAIEWVNEGNINVLNVAINYVPRSSWIEKRVTVFYWE